MYIDRIVIGSLSLLVVINVLNKYLPSSKLLRVIQNVTNVHMISRLCMICRILCIGVTDSVNFYINPE